MNAMKRKANVGRPAGTVQTLEVRLQDTLVGTLAHLRQRNGRLRVRSSVCRSAARPAGVEPGLQSLGWRSARRCSADARAAGRRFFRTCCRKLTCATIWPRVEASIRTASSSSSGSSAPTCREPSRCGRRMANRRGARWRGRAARRERPLGFSLAGVQLKFSALVRVEGCRRCGRRRRGRCGS